MKRTGIPFSGVHVPEHVTSAICTRVFTICSLHTLYDHQRLSSALALQTAGSNAHMHVLPKLIAQLHMQAIPWTAFNITLFCIGFIALKGCDIA